MKSKGKSKIQLFVSQKVRELRENNALTQEQFGEKINRSRSFVANRENLYTKQAFNIDILNDIAKVFKISPKYFMPEEGL